LIAVLIQIVALHATTQEFARRIAEAQIDGAPSIRIRYFEYDSLANMRMKAKVLRAFLRPNVNEALRKFVTSTPQGPHKLATVLLAEANKLLARSL
jgi:hypothetical protein